MSKAKAPATEVAVLKGWLQIAKFLGQPVSVAERWAKSGMPLTRRGRNVYAEPEELNRWLKRESSGEPVQIASPTDDLSASLKQSLSYLRKASHRHDTKTK